MALASSVAGEDVAAWARLPGYAGNNYGKERSFRQRSGQAVADDVTQGAATAAYPTLLGRASEPPRDFGGMSGAMAGKQGTSWRSSFAASGGGGTRKPLPRAGSFGTGSPLAGAPVAGTSCGGGSPATASPSTTGSPAGVSPPSARTARQPPSCEVHDDAEAQERGRLDYGGRDSTGKGPISMLQEFVQCSKEFRLPPRKPILQWSYETRMADHSMLEFRATASFLLGGVPHHAAGAWHPSKKAAQRDAAEGALGLFVGRWGSQLLPSASDEGCAATAHGTPSPGASKVGTSGSGGAPSPPPTPAGAAGSPKGSGAVDDVQVLERFVERSSVCSGVPLFHMTSENDRYQALVEFVILGVLHKFEGSIATGEREAKIQAARRILWYLQCHGYEAAFEPSPGPTCEALSAPPPAHWASSAAEEDALQAAEKKTALMRVQNRLQQMLAQQLRPGEGVWEWSYQPDHTDGSWPPLCRATVRIRALGVKFTGNWQRGHRAAQHDACARVAHYLDQGHANGDVTPTPASGGHAPPNGNTSSVPASSCAGSCEQGAGERFVVHG
eukprot:TRINITY_DN13029_c0_g1_i1.p1 TRINITY_DN13029_c0_g1~~TRINITY_DN13029_c0_g1_i1.p1  ORF type:complete len:557 (+),score=110.81 TRINITY_DN13029_c0_g1_i1:77-1747(+)